MKRLNDHKTIFLLINILCLLSLSAGFAVNDTRAQEAVVVDRIVAVVNDEIITLFDLSKTLKPYEENIKALGYTPEKTRKTLFKLRADALNQMIDQKLADQQIKKNNIKVSTKEIDAAIERIKETRSYTEEDLRAGLAQQGMTMEEYRENLKQQLLRARLVNREVKSKIVVTNEEIQKYYDDHLDKYAGQTKYHIWNISIRFSAYADTAEKQMALQKMESVLAQLKQGRPFDEVAKEVSSTPGMPEGADLGLYQLDELSPELQKVVKNMKAGEFSPILSGPGGHQIVYLEEVLATDPKAISEAKSEIEDILYNDAVNNRYETWLGELRKRSHIKIIQ